MTSHMTWEPLIISAKTATLSILVTFFLGLFIAKKVASMKHEKIKMLLDGVLTLPLVLPPTVAGYFLLYLFGVRRPLGKFFIDYFGFRIAFSWSATVLAAVVIAFPLMYRSARGAFEQVDRDLIDAGRTLGLSENKIFWRIIMPAALPGVASGGVLSFARGLGEFGATAMIAGNMPGKTQTLPLAIYSAVAGGDMRTAGNYVLVITLFSFIVVVALNWFTAKDELKG